MAGKLGSGERARPVPDEWPAWLDEDDFDGLGEKAWLAAMESLAALEPGDADRMLSADADEPMSFGLAPDDAPPEGLDNEGAAREFGIGGAAECMPPGIPLDILVEQAAGRGLTGLSDAEVVTVAGAARRLRNRAEWLEMQATREFARRNWETEHCAVRDSDGRWLFKNSDAEHAPDELAFLLKDSRAAAEDRMELSLALRDRLPCLDRLLAAGLVDERRCQAVRDITIGLTDEQARQVDEMLAPDAADLAYTALRRRAAKLAISLDPDSERERKQRATRKKARVEKFPEKSGNFAFAARELPVEEALASEEFIRGLAAYLRANGVKLNAREAEVLVYLDLTQGRDPRDRIPGRASEAPDATGPIEGDVGQHGASQGDTGPDGGSPHDGAAGSGDDAGEPEFAYRDWRKESGWSGRDWDDYPDDDDDDAGGESGGGDGTGPGGGGGPWPFSPPGPGRPGGRAPFPASINLLVPAGSAYGWSAMPGEAGREIIDPHTLRDMLAAASRHPATRWCVTLVGDDRTAVAHGCARGPHTWDPPPEEATREDKSAALAGFLAGLGVTPEPIAAGACDHRHHEDRYRASRKLRHLIQARDATCPAPGCEASSRYSDMDHTTPWPEGPTDQCNLGAPCRHHHRTKQAPNWKLEQPEPGAFRWTAPSGRVYLTRPTKYDL